MAAFRASKDFGLCCRCHCELKAGTPIIKVLVSSHRRVYGYRHETDMACNHARLAFKAERSAQAKALLDSLRQDDGEMPQPHPITTMLTNLTTEEAIADS